MKPLDLTAVVKAMRAKAMTGTFDGSTRSHHYMRVCRTEHHPSRTVAILTRDVGYHTTGWWKNPDYERCWHLSLSPMPSMIHVVGTVEAELDARTQRAWLDAVFGEDLKRTWFEPPMDRTFQCIGHWRLFCDEHWEPITPRKEVYTREFTEAGWRSMSEVLADQEAAAEEDASR